MGSYIGYPEDFLDAIELISNDIIKVNNLITIKIPLKELISTGFKIMNERNCIKIIVLP
jgi:threonine dehydrogenase-like Zn-dependent dehydrogenase